MSSIAIRIEHWRGLVIRQKHASCLAAVTIHSSSLSTPAFPQARKFPPACTATSYERRSPSEDHVRGRAELRILRLSLAVAISFCASKMFAQSALPFPVKFNEITKGEVEAIISGNDVVIPIADLERFGVQGVMWQRIMNLARLSGATRPVKSAEGVSLRALGPWITYN